MSNHHQGVAEMKVIIEYKLPEEEFLFKCAEEAISNRMLLESIKTTLEAHEKHSVVPEIVVQEIKAQMRGFKWTQVDQRFPDLM